MNKFKVMLGVIGILMLIEAIGVIFFAGKSQTLSMKLTKAKQQLEQLLPGYTKLSQDEKGLTAKYNDLLNETEALKKENEVLKEDRNNLITQAKALMADKTRAKEFEEELNQLKPQKLSLQEERDKLQKKIQSFQTEIAQLREAQAQIAKERDDLKSTIAKMKKDPLAMRLQKENSALQTEKSRLSSTLAKVKKDAEQLTLQRTKVETENSRLRSDLTQFKANYEDAVAKNNLLEQKIGDLPKKFSELARQNAVLLKQTSEMHYNLGVFYTQNKKYDRAAAEFAKAIEINPDDAYAHFNIGYIYAEYLLNRKKAIEHFQQYLRLASSDDKDVEWVKKYIVTWQTWEGKQPMK